MIRDNPKMSIELHPRTPHLTGASCCLSSRRGYWTVTTTLFNYMNASGGREVPRRRCGQMLTKFIIKMDPPATSLQEVALNSESEHEHMMIGLKIRIFDFHPDF